MFVFELRLVNVKGMLCDEKTDYNPYIHCEKCNHQVKLASGDSSIVLNEFQLATMLRVLQSRNKILYNNLKGFYDRVCDARGVIYE